MTTQSNLAVALQRPVPPMGGFSLTVLRLEVRRLLRNRITMFFAIAVPVGFFFSFRSGVYVHQRIERGNETAFELISIALFGAVFATAYGGVSVSIERALGWSRQLRVTPITPVAYIVTKMLTSLVLATGAVGAVYLVGLATNQVSMSAAVWIITGICVLIGSLLFSACGLFIGYLFPSENVTGILSLVIMFFSAAGGLIIPASAFPHTFMVVAEFTPLYGLNELVHYPLVGGTFAWMWVLNCVIWFGLFVLGAVWKFRRDTARV